MGDYSSGLCGCFDDFGICCITYLCPLYTLAKNGGHVDGKDGCDCGTFIFGCFCPLCAVYSVRQKVQIKYGIEEGGCTRCMMSWCCAFCAIQQDARELKKHGNY